MKIRLKTKPEGPDHFWGGVRMFNFWEPYNKRLEPGVTGHRGKVCSIGNWKWNETWSELFRE